jgi:hypothetical protein
MECMSPKDIANDVYVSKNGCNGWTSQRLFNFPSKKSVSSVIVQEGDMDTFLQLLGTLHV